MHPRELHAVTVCPGCGGRNEPGVRVCDWCGRPFFNERRQIAAPWLAPVTVAAIILLGLGTIAVALAGARATGRPPPTSVVLPSPTEEWEPAALVEDEPAPPAAPEPTEAGPPAPREELARIGNTDGSGAFIRREPRAGAPGIIAHRDGIVLRMVGGDVTVEGRLWRQVEDRQGNRGWTPDQYLIRVDGGF